MHEFSIDRRFIYFIHPLHYKTRLTKSFAYNTHRLKITYEDWKHILLIIVDKIYSCPICLSECIEPIVPPCYHQYCKSCLDLLIEKNYSECSICNMHLIGSFLKPVMPNEYLTNVDTQESFFKIESTLKAVNKNGKFKLRKKPNGHKIIQILKEDYSLILLKFIPTNLDVLFHYTNFLKRNEAKVTENFKRTLNELRDNKQKVNEIIRKFIAEFYKEDIKTESFDYVRLDDFHVLDPFSKMVFYSSVQFRQNNLPDYIIKEDIINYLKNKDIRYEYEDYCCNKKKSFELSFIKMISLNSGEDSKTRISDETKNILVKNVCTIILYDLIILKG